MLFDKACGLVDRYYPKGHHARDMLKKARIFQMPEEFDHREYPTTAQDLKAINTMFVLPFDCIAIEVPSISLVMLMSDMRGEDTFGMNISRPFITCCHIFGRMRTDDFDDDNKDFDEYMSAFRVNYSVDFRDCYSIITGVTSAEAIVHEGTIQLKILVGLFDHLDATKHKLVQWHDFVGKDREARDKDENIKKFYHNESGRQARDLRGVYLAVNEINSPTKWIVEETPIHLLKKPKKPQGAEIRRSVDRPKYLILTPTEIRKKMTLQNPVVNPGSRGPLTGPQERRGHWRTYRNEKYSEERREKPQWINSYWAGPHEGPGPGGNKWYRVILDK